MVSFRLRPYRGLLPSSLVAALFVLSAACGDDSTPAPPAPSTEKGGAAGSQGGSSAVPGGSGGNGGTSAGSPSGGAAGAKASGKPGDSCVGDGDCSLTGVETLPSACAEPVCKNQVCGLRARDADADGFRSNRCKLVSDGAFAIELGGDCDDAQKDVNPKGWDGPEGDGNPDHCSDGIDQDCSGAEGDSVTTAGASCACVPDEVETCAQTSAGMPIVFPGGAPAPGSRCSLGSRTCVKDPTTGGKWGPCTNAVGPSQEVCNNADDDCDGKTDEEDAQGQLDWVYDGDGDGYRAIVPGTGAPFAPRTACKAIGRPEECNAAYCGSTPLDVCCPADRWRLASTVPGVDCNDRDATVNPAAAEICANGKDDNCSGQSDERPAVSEQIFYLDADGDGYGDISTPGKQQCVADSAQWKANIPQTDCNDAKAAVNPGVLKEDCSTPDDDNCNNTVKDGCGCSAGDEPLDCGLPTDCNYVKGGSSCVSGSYTPCPPRESPDLYCKDADGDGACNRDDCKAYCATKTAASTAEIVPATGVVRKSECAVRTDCADDDPTRFPGNSEKCGDGDGNKDSDCSGATDPDNGFDLGITCDVGGIKVGACDGTGARVCAGPSSTSCAYPGMTVPATAYRRNAASNGKYDWNCDGELQKKHVIEPRFALQDPIYLDYCIENLPALGFDDGTPPEPAPWTNASCLHPTPDGSIYRVPTCGDFKSQAACKSYYYFPTCAGTTGSGPVGGGPITCPQPCGEEINKLSCAWTTVGKVTACRAAAAETRTMYVGCYLFFVSDKPEKACPRLSAYAER